MMKINHCMKFFGLCAVLFTLGMGMAVAQVASGRYEVKPGDTLYSISRSFGITVQSLKAANPAVGEDNVISIGQVLTIPSADGEVTTTTQTVTTPATEYTTTTTTTIITRYDVDNVLFVQGDMVVNAGLGWGVVRNRGVKQNSTVGAFTQQLSFDYCFKDDVLSGSSLGLGLMVNNSIGGKYPDLDAELRHVDYTREDLSALVTLSLHHQFVNNLDTYVKVGAGVSFLTDQRESIVAYGIRGQYSFAMAAVVGARYYLNGNWGIYAEAGLPTASLQHDFGSSISFVNAGLSYRF